MESTQERERIKKDVQFYLKRQEAFMNAEQPSIHLNYAPKKYLEVAHISKLKLDGDYLLSVKEWMSSSHGFLIFLGRSGAGKTFFSVAIGKELLEKSVKKTRMNNRPLQEKAKKIGMEIDYAEWVSYGPPQYSVEFYNIGDIYRRWKKLLNTNSDPETFLENLKNVDYLLLDDLGASRNTEWQIETIYDLINYRYENMKSTIVTSNFTFKELGDIFHDRLRSRLEAAENLKIEDWTSNFRAQGY